MGWYRQVGRHQSLGTLPQQLLAPLTINSTTPVIGFLSFSRVVDEILPAHKITCSRIYGRATTQFVVGSPIYCGLSTPTITIYCGLCVEDGDGVLMVAPHNFLLSTLPRYSTLSLVEGYISRGPPLALCLTDSFSCYLGFPMHQAASAHIVPCTKEGSTLPRTQHCA